MGDLLILVKKKTEVDINIKVSYRTYIYYQRWKGYFSKIKS